MKRIRLFLLILFVFSSSETNAELYDPVSIFLTWQRDPSTTMTIVWITDEDRTDNDVEFRNVKHSTWQKIEGHHHPMPEDLPYLIHQLELTCLDPNSNYEFRTGPDAVTYKFRTLPSDENAPIRFVVGGDIYNGSKALFKQINAAVLLHNPMFILLGGDLAYAHTKKPWKHPETTKTRMSWIRWLKAWKKQMVTTDGRLIPIIPTIGNHDVTGHFNQTPEQSPFFYAIFPFPGDQGYNVLDMGNFISIFVLDSSHTHPISGEQTTWLHNALKKRKHVPHKFALYHISAYPCYRNYKGKRPKEIRKHWVPLFERYGLATAFEHHDHAYKRTHPILRERIDPNGVLYLGDGGWGVDNIREPKDLESRWYLAKNVATAHFILVTVHKDKRVFYAIDNQGWLIDVVENRASSAGY